VDVYPNLAGRSRSTRHHSQQLTRTERDDLLFTFPEWIRGLGAARLVSTPSRPGSPNGIRGDVRVALSSQCEVQINDRSIR
jgi:hypothetical protein